MNTNLYIRPPMEYHITNENDTPKVTIIPKANRSDVPPMYRKSWKLVTHRAVVLILKELKVPYLATYI